MRLHRLAPVVAVFVLGTIMLSGCAGALFATGHAATSAAPTPTADATHSATSPPSATPTPTTAPSLGGWTECPRIVSDLNAYAKQHPSPLTTYTQIKPADFPLNSVDAALLNGACTLAVTINGETVHWAILPGDPAVASSIKANLLNAGFASGGVADVYGNARTGRAATVTAVANGQALDQYLVTSNVFGRFSQQLVYVGSFALS